MNSRFRSRRVLALALALVALAGVAVAVRSAEGRTDQGPPGSTAGFQTISASSLDPGEVITSPPGETVLTLNGGARQATFDLATLERAGMVRATIYEPFLKEDLSFSGVELGRLVEIAGLPPNADLHLTALDDYQVDLSAADIAAGGILLATRMDDKVLPVAEGGPVRIVFLDSADSGKDTRQWIWSLARIDPVA